MKPGGVAYTPSNTVLLFSKRRICVFTALYGFVAPSFPLSSYGCIFYCDPLQTAKTRQQIEVERMQVKVVERQQAISVQEQVCVLPYHGITGVCRY